MSIIGPGRSPEICINGRDSILSEEVQQTAEQAVEAQLGPIKDGAELCIVQDKGTGISLIIEWTGAQMIYHTTAKDSAYISNGRIHSTGNLEAAKEIIKYYAQDGLAIPQTSLQFFYNAWDFSPFMDEVMISSQWPFYLS